MAASSWYDHMIDQLLEGPMPTQELLAVVAKVVPPGHAFRLMTRERDSQYEKNMPVGGRRPRRLIPMEETTLSGQKRQALQTYRAAIRSGSVVSFELRGKEWAKLGPLATSQNIRRMAAVRCQQSHRFAGDSPDCPSWHEHLREATELFDASLTPSTQLHRGSRHAKA